MVTRMNLLSWLTAPLAEADKTENICKSKREKVKKRKIKINEKDTKKKEKQKMTKKQQLKRMKKKSRISDYMNLNGDYKKKLAERIDDDNEEYYGDLHTRKQDKTVRIWFTNPCGIGIDPYKLKNHNSMSFLCYRSRCDLVGLAEINLNWHMLKGAASFYSRIKYHWRQFRTVTAHNTHAKHGIN